MYRANLKGAHLSDANLKGAGLSNANLEDARLERANLEEADLKNARGLTIEQLSKVKTLYKAKLDPELIEQIKEEYPHLLEKP